MSAAWLLAAVLMLPLLLLIASNPASAMTPEERRAYLEKLQQILPDAPAFRAWLEKSGELPPDFDNSAAHERPPRPPLRFLDGRRVRTAADWKARRVEIQQLFEKYDIGIAPAQAQARSRCCPG